LTFFHLHSYLNHWLNKVDEHSIHSPFFFDFYNQVIKGKPETTLFSPIEATRQKLLDNQTEITIDDLGAPSKHFDKTNRLISKVASTSLNSEKYCQFFFRMADYLEAKNCVELGTSFGITSLYLSRVKNATIHTFEGNADTANVALTNFEYFETTNIKLAIGNIDDTLPEFLQTPQKIDFVLMDANHRYQPTLIYFEWLSKRMADKGVIVVDDINHSPEMKKAWQQLKSNDLVYGSIDLFRCGILFFDPALNKQHYVCGL
jgi:predicted O-methyltransferase YrrM